MDDSMARFYQTALRFDEGELYRGDAYREVMEQQGRLFDLLIATFGAEITPLLNDYTGTLYEEMELEAQHYFREGFRIAREQR